MATLVTLASELAQQLLNAINDLDQETADKADFVSASAAFHGKDGTPGYLTVVLSTEQPDFLRNPATETLSSEECGPDHPLNRRAN